jgi:transposase
MQKTIQLPLDLPINEVAQRYLMAVFERHGGHVVRTAASMNVSQATIYKWLRRGVPVDCRLKGGVPLPDDLKQHEEKAADIA